MTLWKTRSTVVSEAKAAAQKRVNAAAAKSFIADLSAGAAWDFSEATLAFSGESPGNV